MKFLKYWPSSRDLINWLLKSKYMLIHIFEIFFVIWKYNMIYFWETWPYAWKQNILFYLFFYVLPKTGYFNTKLISLQYKNTNRCWLKYRRKQKNHRFLKHFFYFFLFFLFGLGPSRPMWLGWTQPPCWTWPAHLSPCTRNILRVHEQCEGN